ncbi:MAG: FecR domain-containing protein [Sulfurisoma sp.]|nr:FecR domain-containing protein [Sulfurisoma sp.]
MRMSINRFALSPRSVRPLFAAFMFALACQVAMAAQQTGKVLAVSGKLSVQREGKVTILPVGGDVYVGDALTTDTASQAQIRFNDEAIVALRPDTTFRVDEFAFKSAQEPERGLFSLVKGGFRTVTGLIGKTNRDSYRVTTPTATIGIRGTHYAVLLCDSGCRNDDGTAASAGLYGGVNEGRVAVQNDAGAMELGVGEYFYVADRASLPQPLLAPPGFLRERPTQVGRAQATTSEREAPARLTPVPAENRMLVPASTQHSLVLPLLRLADEVTDSSRLVNISPLGSGFASVGGTGTIRGQLVWMTNADLDLHLVVPGGTHVYFGNQTATLVGGAVAQLDHDNVGGQIDVAPDQRVENIIVNGSLMPRGDYTFYAHSYSGNNGGLSTTAVVKVAGADGVLNQYTTTLANDEQSPNYLVAHTPAGSSLTVAGLGIGGIVANLPDRAQGAFIGVNYTVGGAAEVSTFATVATALTASIDLQGGQLGAAGVTATGGYQDLFAWGRWNVGSGSTAVVTDAQGRDITSTLASLSYMYAAPLTNVPTAGSFTYAPVGGPDATFTAGTISVDFANRSVGVNNLAFTHGSLGFADVSASASLQSLVGQQGFTASSLTSGRCAAGCSNLNPSASSIAGLLVGDAARGISVGYRMVFDDTKSVAGQHGFAR